MKRPTAALALASLCSLVLPSPQAQAQSPTYKDIGLDCGGWFVGFAAHSSGRLYGYGDVFGVYRSDGATRGLSWTPLQNGFPKGDNFVMSVAVKTTDADTVAFTTDGSSVYKSTDGGASWTVGLPVVAYNSYNDSLPKDARHYGSTELINSPVSGREREWWVARKRSGNNPTTGQPWVGRLWRTDDDMVNWQKMGGTLFDGDNKPITVYIHPNYPDHVWVGTVDMSTATTGGLGGLYVSTNRGANFTKVWGTGKKGAVIDGKDKPYVNSIVRRASDGMAFIGSNVAGVIISSTNWNTPVQTTEGSNSTGTWKSWDAVPRYTGSGIGTTSVAVLPSGEFLSGKDIVPGVGSVVEKSSVSPASGQTWTTMSTILDPTTPVPSWTVAPAANTNIPSYRSMITIDPLDSTRWYTTGGKSPMISMDSGATWKYPPISNGLAGVNCYSASFPSGAAGANMVFISGADQGIFTFHDAGASGTPTSCSRRRVVDWDGSPTTADDLHQTYHEVMSSTNGESVVAAGVDQGANKNMIITSANGGLNWTRLNLDPVTTGLPANGEGIVRATGKPSNVNDYVVVLGSGRNPSTPGVYRTTTGGASFTKTLDLTNVITGGRTNFLGNTWITRAPDREDTVYLATGGSTAVTKGFRKSIDGGTNWLPLGTQPWGGNHSISGMSVDPAVPGRVWVAYDSTYNGNSNLLFRSDNYGDSWTPLNTYTYFNGANVARVTAANGHVAVWAKKLNDDGFRLYVSKDDGVNWSEATNGNMQTPGSKRYGHALNINMDPYRVGQIWLTGNTSVHVIDTAPNATPVITSALTATGTANSGFSYTINATSTPAATMTYTAAPLPSGLSLSSTGVISGTLPAAGTYSIVLTATGAYRTSAPVTLTLNVAALVATPTFNPVGGTYTGTQNVTISSATSGASIRYTTDNSNPTSTTGTVVTGPVSVAATTTLKAIAYKSGSTDSSVASATYTINSGTAVATPTYSLSGGTYPSTQSVTISSSTSGASIRYTTNGTDPTSTTGTAVTGAISVATTTSFRARAFKSGSTDSAVAYVTYTITAGADTAVDRTDEAGATLTARASIKETENHLRAFDNNTLTKWLDNGGVPTTSAPSWIVFEFAGTGHAINRYVIAAANDAPERDPKSWSLKASNDAVPDWANATVLNSQTNQTFTARFERKTYDFVNTTVYKKYRLEITANYGNSSLTQLSEIELLTVDSGAPTASFVSSDATTSGTWIGVYGAGGYDISQDTRSLPAYVSSLTFANKADYTWAASSSDTRATQRGVTGRIAACWYSGSNFDISMNITGSTSKQVALYSLDWDNQGRTQTIQPFDAVTGASLSTAQAVSGFQNGNYVIYSVKGNVRFRVTNTGSPNAVVSAVLFGN